MNNVYKITIGKKDAFFKKIFYSSTVDLQCCANFTSVQKSDSVVSIYIYIHILFHILSMMVYHRILNIVICAMQ